MARTRMDVGAILDDQFPIAPYLYKPTGKLEQEPNNFRALARLKLESKKVDGAVIRGASGKFRR
jgi:hypothetical protein